MTIHPPNAPPSWRPSSIIIIIIIIIHSFGRLKSLSFFLSFRFSIQHHHHHHRPAYIGEESAGCSLLYQNIISYTYNPPQSRIKKTKT